MPREIRTYVFMVAVCLALVFAVSLVPPLTNGGGRNLAEGVTQAELDAAMSEERAHCEALGAGVDCACYAEMAGYVRSVGTPSVPFSRSLDQMELARLQARASC